MTFISALLPEFIPLTLPSPNALSAPAAAAAIQYRRQDYLFCLNAADWDGFLERRNSEAGRKRKSGVPRKYLDLRMLGGRLGNSKDQDGGRLLTAGLGWDN